MAEADESSSAAVTQTKKVINSRVEIDTSPPFESVKEAVDHFGGGGPWIPHHMLRLGANHQHDSEVFSLDKVEEQASQLEKDLLKKKQETLHVLQELDAAKRFVEGLKLNLMQEMSSFMASSDMKPEAHNSAGSLSWCPPAASPGSISMELNQAKINLGKTTTDLAVIQASVESLSRKVKDEQNLLDKITERKAMDFYGSNMVTRGPRQRCLVNDTNGSAMNESNDVQETNFEAEQFKKMTEASKYEVMKAMSEIERTKTSIKMAEMRLTAARKMEEAAKAVEAIALAEKHTKIPDKSDGITLSFEQYNALTYKAQQADDSCRNKFIDSNVRTSKSEASIMKKLDPARRRKKSLEEVMGREDYFDRRIRGNGNNYSGETIENEQTQHEDQNAGRFRFKNSRLQPLDENENENESNLKTSPVYRSTISIGDILGRKLILQDDIVVGKHMERHAEREQVSLSQMLREQSGLILHPPPNSSSIEGRGAEKQYYTQRKKFGFIHISIPRQSKKKAQVLN